ncbi:MAG TPA: class I SAM-dependent methyltransferase [Gaiellaceae bacterium]|nr:class I SAM-dependent methyltransferase [Gaiellaceae bacterium]
MEDVRDFYERPDIVAKYRSDGELWRSERKLVERHFAPGSRVLEVGTGGGRAALALAKLGYRVSALDLSAALVAAARESAERQGLDIDFVVGDARALPYADATFDGSAFLCNGVGHLDAEAMRACFGELARVTKPSGAVLISFRTPYALHRLLPGLVARALSHPRRRDESVDGGAYVHRPSAGHLVALAREGGLDVVERTSNGAAAAGRPARPWELYLGGQFFLVARSS